jgi:hypothetical protein
VSNVRAKYTNCYVIDEGPMHEAELHRVASSTSHPQQRVQVLDLLPHPFCHGLLELVTSDHLRPHSE